MMNDDVDGYRMAMFWVEHVARLKGSLSHAFLEEKARGMAGKQKQTRLAKKQVG
jgi:hypothetical protein